MRRLYRTIQDAIFIAVRGSEVLLRLSPLIVLTPASLFSFHYLSSSRLNEWTWDYVRSTITSLGPCFVKLAQWVATRRDIFPPHLCNQLSILQDKGLAHNWKHTDRMLRRDFGNDYRQYLQVKSIIGSGSAGQVYEGVLCKENNETVRVAIKVLHPNLHDSLQRDLWFIQTVAEFLHSFPIATIKMLSLPRVVSNFGFILTEQADLTVEANNLLQFHGNFYKSKQSSIVFPIPMKGWISQDVLVEELVTDATPIADFLHDSSEQGLQTRRELAGPLLRAFLKMVFLDNFVHCDLHAGNILVQTTREPKALSLLERMSGTAPTPELETKRKIVFLDAGITTSLKPNDQRNLIDLFRAVILNNGYEAGQLMVERARYERCSQIPGGVHSFASGVEALVSEFHDRRKSGLTLGAVRIGGLLSRVLELCRVYGVEIDPAMASIVVSTLVLEGLGRSLEPDLNLIDFAIPFVLRRGQV